MIIDVYGIADSPAHLDWNYDIFSQNRLIHRKEHDSRDAQQKQ